VIERLENPVFRQSSRQRMRGARTYGCLMAYLLTLALVVLIAYDQFMGRGQQRTTSGLAQTLFETLVLTQWFLVAFIAPALTTSAITMEREQRTYDLLMITPLSRFAIVWGKFASALAFVVVMILCGMPLVAVLFLMGGVDVGIMLERYIGMLITGVLLTAFGLMMSAICATSTLANLLTYGGLAIGYFVAAAAGTAFVMSRAFGGGVSGGASGIFWFSAGWNTWQLWGFVIGHVLLVALILLQIAANYLLPDPRQGAWKTRLLTAILYVDLLVTAAMDMAKGLATVPVPHLMAKTVVVLLGTITPAVATGIPLSGVRWVQWLHPRSLRMGAVQSAPLYLLGLLLAGVVVDAFMPLRVRSSLLAWWCAAGYLWWLWCMGYMVSAWMRNRWGALFALLGMLYTAGYFFVLLGEYPHYTALKTLVNLSIPAVLFESKGNLALWGVLYPVLAAVALAGGVVLGNRGHRRAAAGN